MKKNYVAGLLAIVFVIVSAFVVWFSIGATDQQQDLRGQAYTTTTPPNTGTPANTNPGTPNTGSTGTGNSSNTGSSQASCSENQVNVQFRKWTGEETPWINGSAMTLKTGEYVDVNCFAKTGTALLQNPVMIASITANGATTPITLPNANSAEVRKLAITKSGTYVFTCHNTSNTCNDSDQFVIAPSTSPSPSPSVAPSASDTPTAGETGSADLNGDGVIDIYDYAILYNAYIQSNGL